MDYKELHESYSALLKKAITEYDSFSLLWSRPKGHHKASASIREWSALLEPYLLEEKKWGIIEALLLKAERASKGFIGYARNP